MLFLAQSATANFADWNLRFLSTKTHCHPEDNAQFQEPICPSQDWTQVYAVAAIKMSQRYAPLRLVKQITHKPRMTCFLNESIVYKKLSSFRFIFAAHIGKFW